MTRTCFGFATTTLLTWGAITCAAVAALPVASTTPTSWLTRRGRAHLRDFVDAYNFARRLKTIRALPLLKRRPTSRSKSCARRSRTKA